MLISLYLHCPALSSALAAGVDILRALCHATVVLDPFLLPSAAHCTLLLAQQIGRHTSAKTIPNERNGFLCVPLACSPSNNSADLPRQSQRHQGSLQTARGDLGGCWQGNAVSLARLSRAGLICFAARYGSRTSSLPTAPSSTVSVSALRVSSRSPIHCARMTTSSLASI